MQSHSLPNMIANRQPDDITVEEYLAAEASSEIKHEYQDGYVCAMAGASDAYVTITVLSSRNLSVWQYLHLLVTIVS